jgi:predicted nuclease of restriction endonuclease-like RecB superfamily
VLTADLVQARRRGGELRLVGVGDVARARELAARITAVVSGHVGLTRAELDEALLETLDSPREERLKAGLVKLALDRCTFEADAAERAPELRAALFAAGARARREGTFDRAALVHGAARAAGLGAEELERVLFADLRAAHRLLAYEAIGPEALVHAYERSQVQAVLLRAVKVTLDVDASPGALRALFRKLKFLRLLHTIEKKNDSTPGHRVVLDGPFSLWGAVTKYGLQLAMVVPALDACDAWSLEAELRWGKERTPLVFRTASEARARRGDGEGDGRDATAGDALDALPDGVRDLARSFAALDSPWNVDVADRVLDLPGVGLAVPDLVFTKKRRKGTKGRARAPIYLEVLGYWSRDAVWRRVELAEKGLAERVLFAVSARLRVSEDVLDEHASASLYVYKGAMSARAILARLDAMG